MADPTRPAEAAEAGHSDCCWPRRVRHETTRLRFALAAAGILVALAFVSRSANWELLGRQLWWVWLVVAAPYCALSALLLVGLGRLVRHERRREIVIALLALVRGFNVLGVLVLVASLVADSAVHLTGRQLLFSGGAVWLTDAVAFGLAFWELDVAVPLLARSPWRASSPISSSHKTRIRSLPRMAGIHAYGITSTCP